MTVRAKKIMINDELQRMAVFEESLERKIEDLRFTDSRHEMARLALMRSDCLKAMAQISINKNQN